MRVGAVRHRVFECTSAGSATGQQLPYEAFDSSAGLIEAPRVPWRVLSRVNEDSAPPGVESRERVRPAGRHFSNFPRAGAIFGP